MKNQSPIALPAKMLDCPLSSAPANLSMLGCILTPCIHFMVPTRKLQRRGLAFSIERCIYFVIRYDYGRYRGCLDLGFLVRGSFTWVGFRFERSVDSECVCTSTGGFRARRRGWSSQSLGLSYYGSSLAHPFPNHVFHTSIPPFPSLSHTPSVLLPPLRTCRTLHSPLVSHSSFPPPEPIPTVGREDPDTHLVERRHGLVRAPYLDLVEEGRGAVAAFAGALRCEGERENALALVEM